MRQRLFWFANVACAIMPNVAYVVCVAGHPHSSRGISEHGDTGFLKHVRLIIGLYRNCRADRRMPPARIFVWQRRVLILPPGLFAAAVHDAD